MKLKLLFIMTFFVLIQQQLMAKEITICSGEHDGSELSCVGNYIKDGTNLVALYAHNWRLITIAVATRIGGSSYEGSGSISSSTTYTYFLER